MAIGTNKKKVSKTSTKTAGKLVGKTATKAAKQKINAAKAMDADSAGSGAISSIGKSVPSSEFLATNSEGKLKLTEFKGMKVVLYFYPKDNTPGCTLEGQDFRRLIQDFKKENAIIIGVSRDSIKSHKSFIEKCSFPFDLISDPDEKLCRYFDVIQMKSMYGKKFEGVERSTFVINAQGKVAHEWRRVKVTGHANEVLEVVKTLA